MVECDDQTAELHMAMAEMMGKDDGEANVEQGPVDQLNRHAVHYSPCLLYTSPSPRDS